MISIPQIVPISDFRLHQAEVLQKLQKGPIFLAQHSQPAAVLISTEQWEEITEQLEMLEDAMAIFKTRMDLAAGHEIMTRLSEAELKEWLGDAVLR